MSGSGGVWDLSPSPLLKEGGTHPPNVTLLEIIREKSYNLFRHFIGCQPEMEYAMFRSPRPAMIGDILAKEQTESIQSNHARMTFMG